MPYPCTRFYADIKFDIRFDNRFDIKLWNSIHVKHTINFVTELRFMVWFNMEAIPKSNIKSDISFDISIKPTTWIGHKSSEHLLNGLVIYAPYSVHHQIRGRSQVILAHCIS